MNPVRVCVDWRGKASIGIKQNESSLWFERFGHYLLNGLAFFSGSSSRRLWRCRDWLVLRLLPGNQGYSRLCRLAYRYTA